MRTLAMSEIGFVGGGSNSNQSSGSRAGGFQVAYDYRQATCQALMNRHPGACQAALEAGGEVIQNRIEDDVARALNAIGRGLNSLGDSISGALCRVAEDAENMARAAAKVPPTSYGCR
jgi:hypothetical protein